MVAHDPLQRSGRAELPHPALSLGDNARLKQTIRRLVISSMAKRTPSRPIPLILLPPYGMNSSGEAAFVADLTADEKDNS